MENQNNEIALVAQNAGLAPTGVENLLKRFAAYFNEAKKLAEGAREIIVTDESQTDLMLKAREARLSLKSLRTHVEAVRVELKEQSLREGRAIDGVSNLIKALIVPVEEHLEKQEKYAEVKALERIQKKYEERVNLLSPFVEDISLYAIKDMPDAVFDNLLAGCKASYQAKKDAEAKAEADRIAKEKEKEEEDRKIREENEKLKKEAEEKQNALFDKRLAEEEVWIRQGIKARRTRNEGRVRALKELREQSKARRSQQGKVTMATQEASRSGRVVFEIDNLSVRFGDNAPIIKDFSALVLRGDRIGLVGDNGVGKTTLIKAILGEQEHTGVVKTGTQLEVAYFDQLRNALDLEKSVKDNVSEGSDHVDVNGSRRHIYSYLQDFLFSPERARTPVKALSGGERNRILLAKLLLKPSNLIVMDEPTNDLDMVTLELLEEMLGNYKGTLLLISHDRAFMDNVVTSTWVFDGKGTIDEYVGGYQDYLEQRPDQTVVDQKSAVKKAVAKAEAAATAPAKKVKLSYKDQRALDQLPAEIEALEQEQAQLSEKLADGSWFMKDADAATQASQRLAEIDDLMLEKMERLEELENMTK